MGLDSVEILMRVEETFGIKIPDQEAQEIVTVGDFHSTVWRHLSGRHSNNCQSQKLFYKLRRSFAEQYEIPSQQLNTNTSPDKIFPVTNRRYEYMKFSTETSLNLPDLILPDFWQTILISVGFAAIGGGLITSLVWINFFGYSKWMLLIPIAGIIVTVILSELLDPKRVVIGANTVRAFTQQTLNLNYSMLVREDGTNRTEMESVINHIIIDQAGLDPEEVTPDKKIGDDLGID